MCVCMWACVPLCICVCVCVVVSLREPGTPSPPVLHTLAESMVDVGCMDPAPPAQGPSCRAPARPRLAHPQEM